MEWDKGDRRKGLGARENALLNLRMAQESGNGFLLEHVLRRERNPARAFCEVAGAALALLAAGLLAGRDLERSRVRRNVFDRHWLGMLYVRYRKNRRLEHGGGCRRVPAFFGWSIDPLDEPMAKPMAALNAMGVSTANCCCGNLGPGWRGHSSSAYFSVNGEIPACLELALARDCPGSRCRRSQWGVTWRCPPGEDARFVEAMATMS